MTCSAGELRELLMLLRSEDVSDELGGFDVSWNEVKTFYGKLEPIHPNAVYGNANRGVRLGGASGRTNAFKITIRSQQGIENGDRLKWKKTILSIVTKPLHDQSNGWLTFYAVELQESEGGIVHEI